MLMVLNVFVVKNQNSLLCSHFILPPMSYLYLNSSTIKKQKNMKCGKVDVFYTLLIQSDCELLTAERLASWKIILLQN